MIDIEANRNKHKNCEQNYKKLTTDSNTSINKYYKPIICSLDSIISTVVVTPLVVGMWRALWTLMDIYHRFFPPWETFLFGMMIHLGFAMIGEILQNKINDTKRNIYWNIFTFFSIRLFTYFFAIINTLHWRGGWIVFDQFFGIMTTPDDHAVVPEVHFWTVCGVILMLLLTTCMMRCFKNVMSPPFIILMDFKETAFDFPTRFRVKVTYTVYYINSSEKKLLDDAITTPNTHAEKLTSADLLSDQLKVRKESPRPFGNEFLGPAPSKFTMPTFISTTTTTTRPKTKQMRNIHYPRNIQEIISYISITPRKPEESVFALNEDNQERYKQSQTSPLFSDDSDLKNISSFKTIFERNQQDPFFLFKPQDPSEINLMSIRGFRFSPPVWKNFRNQSPKQVALEKDNDFKQSTVKQTKETKKPLLVTFNIFPTENDMPVSGRQINLEKPVAQPLIQEEFLKPPLVRFNPTTPTNRIPYKMKNKGKLGKMIIHLRLFEDSSISEPLHEEKRKNVLAL